MWSACLVKPRGPGRLAVYEVSTPRGPHRIEAASGADAIEAAREMYARDLDAMADLEADEDRPSGDPWGIDRTLATIDAFRAERRDR